jgi:hypothetical protein
MSGYFEARGVKSLHFLDVLVAGNIVDRVGFESRSPPRHFVLGIKRAAVQQARAKYGQDAEVETRFNLKPEPIIVGNVRESEGRFFYHDGDKSYLVADVVQPSESDYHCRRTA